MTFQTDEALQSYLMAIDNELDLTLSLATQSSSNIFGKGFYSIPILRSETSQEISLRIQIFDSSDEDCIVSGQSCITQSQLSQFQSTSQTLSSLSISSPVLGFSHQAVPEMIYLWNSSEVFNEKHSKTRCTSAINITAALLDHLSYLVMGNDQYNSFGGEFRGIQMMYAPTSSGLEDARAGI